MDRRREIVESQFEPSVNSLWLYKKTLKIFINGKWEVLGTNLSPEEVEELKTKVDSMDKELGEVKQDINIINSKVCVELEIGNSEEVKSRNLVKLKAIQSIDHLFFADIDYGYGAAKWLPTTGGEAFIVTSSGRAVIYTIGNDGSVTKASTDIDLTNPNTDLFEVVTELPTENISTSKLYCVLSSKVGEENKYTEYAYIKQTDGQFAWEKMGEFKAEPDLSGYAKLNNNVIFNSVTCKAGGSKEALHIKGEAYIEYLRGVRRMVGPTYFPSGDFKENMVYSESGSKTDVGKKEDFVFTLEDGSTVTKSIRVISTTTSKAGA